MSLQREYVRSLRYPTHNGYGVEKIRKVQEIVLDMGIRVCQILEYYEIPYFITNGTLIGAALYESFVPWDDDFDIFLFDDSYDRAMDVLELELPQHLVVHGPKNDPLYFPAWNRIKNLNTYAEDSGLYNPDNRLLKYPCLSVDLYRIKRIKESEVELYKIYEAKKFFERKRNSGIINLDKYNSEIDLLKAREVELHRIEKIINDRNVYMFMVMLKRPLSENEIFPLKRYSFEGKLFWGPNSYDALLTSLYGNYKIVPEYEKRSTRFSHVDIKG